MKKRFLSAVLVMALLLTMVPMATFAANEDHEIKMVLVKDTTTFDGKEVLRVDFMYKSGEDIPESQMVYLKYDAEKLSPLAQATGADASSYASDFSAGGMAGIFTKNIYEYQDPIIGPQPSTPIFYTIITDVEGYDVGYIGWKVEKDYKDARFEEFTRKSSIFFGLKDGVTFDSFPRDVFELCDMEGDTVVTSASCIAEVVHSGSTSIFYYGGTGDDLKAPYFEEGDGVTFEEIVKVTPVCDAPTGLTATYGTYLKDLLPLTNPSTNTDGTWEWNDKNLYVGPVGTNEFYANFIPYDGDYYESVSGISVSILVTAKNLTDVAVADISDQEYTGNEIKPSLTVVGDSGKALKVNEDYTVEHSNNINVGIATVTVKAKSGANYNFSDITKTFNIVKQTGSVTVTGNLDKTYDASPVDPNDLTVNTNSTGALTYKYYTDVEGTQNESSTAPTNAGTYSVRVNVEADSNYGAATSDPLVFTIAKASLTAEANDVNITYGDAVPIYSMNYDGFKGSDSAADLDTSSLAYVCDYNTGDDAGEYSISPSGVSSENYIINFKSGKLTVKPKKLLNGMMDTSSIDVTYNTMQQTPKPEIKDGTTTLVEGTDFVYAYENNINAGTATVKANGINNYEDTATGTFNIKQAEYVYTVDGEGASILVGSGLDAITIAPAAGTGVNGESVSGSITWYSDYANNIVATDADINTKAVGDVVSLNWEFEASNLNYSQISKIGAVSFEIVDGAPQDLALQIPTDIEKTYGDEDYTNAAINNSPGGGAISYVSSDMSVATVDGDGKVTILKSGTTDITATAAAVIGTYTETKITYTLTVGKKTVSATAGDVQISREYDGTKNPGTVTGTVSTTGILATDLATVTVVLGTTPDYDNENVHTATLSLPVLLSGDSNNNYVLGNTTIDVPASITPKNLGSSGPTVSITSSHSYTNSAITPTFTVKDGAVDLAKTDYEFALSNNVNAGVGELTVSQKSGGNYIWDNDVKETFAIDKGTYGGTVKGSISIRYGATGIFDFSSLLTDLDPTDYELELNVIGGSITDNATIVGNTLQIKLKNDPNIVGDKAGITVRVKNLKNYADFSAEIAITVADKNIQDQFKFDVSAMNKVYGDDDFTVTATGEVTGSSVTYASDDISVATVDSNSGKVSILKAGTATITATASATADYAVTTDSYALTVSPAAITIQVTDKTAYINNAAPDISSPVEGVDYYVIGLVGSDILGTYPALSYGSAPDMTVAGTVAIVASGANVPSGGNYDATITYIDGNLTIKPKSSGGGTTVLPTVPAANGKVKVNYREFGNTADPSLTTAKINEIIENSIDGKTDIDFSNVKKISTVNIPKVALNALAEANTDLEIKLPEGNITITSESIPSLIKQIDGMDIKIELNKIGSTNLKEEQKKAIKSGDLIFDINLYSGAEKITDFDGTLKVELPYDGTLPVAVWHLTEKGELEKVVSTYDKGIVNFSLNHLSLFVIGEELSEQVWANPFRDVKEGDWFFDSVKFTYDNGLITGTSKTDFSPQLETTRGMIVSILYRLEGSPKVDLEGLFKDVKANQYYAKAIAWAASNEIVIGYSEDRFGPDDFITREQMTLILMNYAKFKGYDISKKADISGFADAEEISTWASDAMSWANAEGFIQGSGKRLMPKASAQRAQVAAILHRFIEKNSKR